MTIKSSDLKDRAGQVAAGLRGQAPLAGDTPANPLLDRAIDAVAKLVAAAAKRDLVRYRDDNRGVSIYGSMLQATEDWPKAERDAVTQRGLPSDEVEKLLQAIERELGAVGLKADHVFLDDGYETSSIQIVGLKSKSPQDPGIEARGVAPATTPLPVHNPATAQKLIQATASLIDDASTLLRTEGRPGAQPHPLVMQKLVTALEKVARQLRALAATPELQHETPGLEADLRELKRSYANLLLDLSARSELVLNARVAEYNLDRIGLPPPTGKTIWQSALGLLAKKKEEQPPVGNFATRLQEALAAIIAGAPIVAPPKQQTRSAIEALQTSLPFVTRDMLAQPGAAALLSEIALSKEWAKNAEALGRRDEAKQGYRAVAADLLFGFGPTLQTAAAMVDLGDFEARSGRDDRASRAYLGALRVLLTVVERDHPLVVETAQKLDQTSRRWLATLDPDATVPMPLESRWAIESAEKVSQELGLDQLLQTKPKAYPQEKVEADTWAAALNAGGASERPRWDSKTDQAQALRWSLHHAIYGPMDL